MIVELKGVTKIFGTETIETKAVAEVDLRIEPGDYLAVRGPSGSGKSTLLSLIGLLDKPTSGQILIDGEDVSRAPDAKLAALRRDLLGFVFQAFHLIPHLNVFDNVGVALEGTRIPRRERKARIAATLDRLGLGARALHRPAQLSGGQQQRVALARAIVRRPRLLICDEPTGNLDTANSEIVMQAVNELHGDGTAVLLVTHDEGIARHARRELHMKDGALLPGS